jgi:hypothetical protein
LANPAETGVEYGLQMNVCLADQPDLNLPIIMMTQSSSNSTTAQVERHFTVRFSKYDSADRDEIERFIIDIFHHTYGADIKRFKPYLMSLRDQDDKLIAVCGLHSAATERLFLESFLDQPIEAVLSVHTGFPVKRGDIVEIDNFSVAELGMSRHLVTAINDQLYFTSKQWAVLTATPALRDVFIDLGLNPEILADTDMNLLTSEDRLAWGKYFEQKPQIMAIRRTERRNKPRAGNTGISAP